MNEPLSTTVPRPISAKGPMIASSPTLTWESMYSGGLRVAAGDIRHPGPVQRPSRIVYPKKISPSPPRRRASFSDASTSSGLSTE